jgi:hypothetical protein
MQVLQKRELARCQSNPNSYTASGRLKRFGRAGGATRRTALLREAPARSISPSPLRKLPDLGTLGADMVATDPLNQQQLLLAKVCRVSAACVLGSAGDVQQQQHSCAHASDLSKCLGTIR